MVRKKMEVLFASHLKLDDDVTIVLLITNNLEGRSLSGMGWQLASKRVSIFCVSPLSG